MSVIATKTTNRETIRAIRVDGESTDVKYEFDLNDASADWSDKDQWEVRLKSVNRLSVSKLMPDYKDRVENAIRFHEFKIRKERSENQTPGFCVCCGKESFDDFCSIKCQVETWGE
jgi:hypothetical protein